MANIFGGILGQVYSILMAAYVSDVLIGNYKIATNFTILLTFITTPITTVLFPAFSKLDPQKEKTLLKNVFTSSVKYTVLLVVPATMAMIVLSKPLISTLYGDKYPYAPLFLSLSIVYNLLALFGWRSMGQFLPAMGETKLVMYINLLSLLISIPLAFLLVPKLGIIGIIVGVPASALVSTFLGLYIEWKRYGVKADLHSSAKILLATAFATAATYLFLTFFTAHYWELFVAGAILFLVVYLISAPLVGAINQADLDILRAMFSSLGIVSKVLEIPFKTIEKILKMRKSIVKTKRDTALQ